MLNLNEDQPIILFFDSVNNNKENIWSLLNMSQGAIHTPAGDIIPSDKIYDNKNLKQLPEATAEKSINAGLNKFSFTGQDWPQKFHITGGINWDLYTLTNSNTSFTLSQWTNVWQNSLETSEFLQTVGKPYTETQQILRVKSSAPFFHIVLPYFKGTEPYKNNVQLMAPDKIKIKYGSGEILVTSKYYYYSAGNKIIISTFTAQPAFEKGFGINGGITETEIDGDSIKIRVHGNSGKRIITLPFPVANAGKNKDAQIIRGTKNARIIIDYKSAGADLLSNEQGYTEYVFKKLN
jgi:hypothetical protein